MSQNNNNIQEVVDLLKTCKSILIITGAGISADSGLPTYRGAGGIYNDALTDEGIPIETALAGETLRNNPEITWKYLSQIEQTCRGAEFNRAHAIIAEMENYFERVWTLTQNIDGFHKKAGSKKLIEIHGNMYNIVCSNCLWRDSIKNFSEITIPPECPRCQNIVRPDVVFFGEILPTDKFQLLMNELSVGFDLYFSIGTTSFFPYIRGPVEKAKLIGQPTIEINPDETEISDIVDIKIRSGAVEALEKIWEPFAG